MIDVYKIGISIAMQNGVSSVLKVIQRDLFGLQKQVDFTQGSFDRLKRAALGAMGVVAGSAALRAVKDLADAGQEITNQQGKMLQLGISYRNVMRETAVAAQAAAKYSGSTTSGNLAALTQLRSILGGKTPQDMSEANAALPAYLKAQFVLASNGLDPSQLGYFLKALDVQGAFVKNGKLDPTAFGQALQEAIASVLTTGGLLTGQDFYQASRLSNPAGQAMGTEKYLEDMTEVLVALGNRGARGLEYAAQDLIGGTMSKAQVERLEKLRLLSPKDVRDTGGGRYLADTTKIKGADLLMKGDIIDWLHQYFLPAASAAGMNALQAGAPFQQTMQSLISFLATNWPQIVRSQEQQDAAKKTDQYSIAQQMYSGALDDFNTALTNLWQTLGVPAAKDAAKILEALAGGIRDLTGWFDQHPTMARVVVTTLEALGVALTVLGGAAIVTALAAMVGSGGYIALVAGGMAGLGVVIWKLPQAIDAFDSAMQGLMKDVVGFVQTLEHLWDNPSPTPAPKPAPIPTPAQVKARYGGNVPLGAPSQGAYETQHAAQLNATMLPRAPSGFAAGTPDDPVHVVVSNPGDIGKASGAVALRNLHQGLNAPQTGPSGFNGRAAPYGTPAVSVSSP